VSHVAKTTLARLCAVLLLAPLFSGCSFTKNQNGLMDKVVLSAPLGNGKALNVGYKLPDAAAGCQLVDDSSRNWAKVQTVGQLKAGGGRQVLQEDAVDSVKRRPDAGINYVALTIPNEAGLGVINLSIAAEAKTSYFRCTSPPSPR
jgi:hypothetical protein